MTDTIRMKNEYEIDAISQVVTIKIVSKTYGTFYTKIDLADFPEVSNHIWGVHRHRAKFYAATKTFELQNFLCQPGPGMVSDHIDRDPLNNLRSNLRVVTARKNMHNRTDLRQGYAVYS